MRFVRLRWWLGWGDGGACRGLSGFLVSRCWAILVTAAALSYSLALSLWSPPLRSHAVSRARICVASWGCVRAALVGFRVRCAGCVRVVVSLVAMRFARCDALSTLRPRLGVVDFLVVTCACPDLVDSIPSSVPGSVFRWRVWWVAQTVRWRYWLSAFAVGRGVSGLFVDLLTSCLGFLRPCCGCARDFRVARLAGGLYECLDSSGH
jgi:hypothetical protein